MTLTPAPVEDDDQKGASAPAVPDHEEASAAPEDATVLSPAPPAPNHASPPLSRARKKKATARQIEKSLYGITRRLLELWLGRKFR